MLLTTNEAEVIKEKRIELANRMGTVFIHDNTEPHTSLVTSGKLLQLCWEVMSKTTFNSDMPPFDYHLFRSVQNSSNSKIFTNDNIPKSHLNQYFADKDHSFYD